MTATVITVVVGVMAAVVDRQEELWQWFDDD